jgi:hypothetical protein
VYHESAKSLVKKASPPFTILLFFFLVAFHQQQSKKSKAAPNEKTPYSPHTPQFIRTLDSLLLLAGRTKRLFVYPIE